jgi:hypothetical protein
LVPDRSETSAGAGPEPGAGSPSRGCRGRWRATTWSRTLSTPSPRARTSRRKISARPSRAYLSCFTSGVQSRPPRCAFALVVPTPAGVNHRKGEPARSTGAYARIAQKKSDAAYGFRDFETREVGVYGNLGMDPGPQRSRRYLSPPLQTGPRGPRAGYEEGLSLSWTRVWCRRPT